jgi:hypothetical protein
MFIMYKIHSSFINLDYGYMIMNVLGDKDHWSSILEMKKEQNRTEQNSTLTEALAK